MSDRRDYFSSKSLKVLVNCKCPCCKTIHKMKMEYTGRGIPQKLCKKCRKKG